jgi:putative membrane protein
MRFLLKLLLNGVALIVADWLIDGLHLADVTTAIIAGVILGLVNALVKPVLFILTLPFTLITLGLFLFVLNAICLALAARLVPGFEIDGWWPAFWGALIVTVVSWLLNGLIPGEENKKRVVARRID